MPAVRAEFTPRRPRRARARGSRSGARPDRRASARGCARRGNGLVTHRQALEARDGGMERRVRMPVRRPAANRMVRRPAGRRRRGLAPRPCRSWGASPLSLPPGLPRFVAEAGARGSCCPAEPRPARRGRDAARSNLIRGAGRHRAPLPSLGAEGRAMPVRTAAARAGIDRARSRRAPRRRAAAHARPDGRRQTMPRRAGRPPAGRAGSAPAGGRPRAVRSRTSRRAHAPRRRGCRARRPGRPAGGRRGGCPRPSAPRRPREAGGEMPAQPPHAPRAPKRRSRSASRAGVRGRIPSRAPPVTGGCARSRPGAPSDGAPGPAGSARPPPDWR